MAKVTAKNLPSLMKRRITLQTAARISDSQGGYTESWSDVAVLWASIDPLKGWEKMQAMQLETPVTHKVTIRYRSDVTTAQRFVYETRVFNIKEVINLNEEKAFMQLMASEMA